MRIYLSPSNQEHNVGKGKYGSEEQRMHELAAKVAGLLRDRGVLTRISQPEWSMEKVVSDSNNWNADAHICIHTNAGGGDGTVAFYGSAKGKRLTQCIYSYVAPLSPGKDEGLKEWAGLYEIAHTHSPCAYLELFFHDNYQEVTHYLAHIDDYAVAIAKGICEHFKVPWKKEVDYRPLKKEAVKVAKLLGIPVNVDVTAPGKGKPFEDLLRAIAEK